MDSAAGTSARFSSAVSGHPGDARLSPQPGSSSQPRPRAQRAPWLGIGLIAAGAFALEMAVSARYGYARDELYFLSAGHHLAFGYVDQPPLIALIAKVSRQLKESIAYGLAHREAALDHAMQYARGLARRKADTFVGMYVNGWTLDYGDRGRAAVRELIGRGVSSGMIPGPVTIEFAD